MIDKICETGVIPVIKLTNIEDAVPLAKALRAGGINAAEVTFRAEGAEQVIAAMLHAYPDMLVGAGTVINQEQAQRASEAGAKFLVSPGIDPEIVLFAKEHGMLALPGCVTPAEIQQALKLGLSVVKFFPAEQYGGLSTIKALSGPFCGLKFMPTGGITLKNLGEYAAHPSVAACGGSYMVTEELLHNRRWEEVAELSRKSVEIVRAARTR